MISEVYDRIEKLEYNSSVKTGLLYRILPPQKTLKQNKGMCLDAALLAAHLLEISPNLLIMRLSQGGHGALIVESNGKYGAITKSRHDFLGSRIPTFDSIADLAQSYGADSYGIADWQKVYPNWDTRRFAMRPSVSLWYNLEQTPCGGN